MGNSHEITALHFSNIWHSGCKMNHDHWNNPYRYRTTPGNGEWTNEVIGVKPV